MARQPKLPSGMARRGEMYYSAFRVNGRLVRRKLSSNFRAACEILTALRARADRADFDLADNDLPLVDLRKDYRRHAEQSLRPRSAHRALQNVASVLDGGQRKGKGEKVAAKWAGITATKVSQLTAARVLEWRAERLATGAAPRTVNMEVGAVSTMLNWAKRHKQIATNPLAEISQLPEDVKQKNRRALTVEEVQRLFDASPDHLKPVWRLFLTAGVRLEELETLRFADVDLDRRTATVRAEVNKSHKAREIPLDDATVATISVLADAAPNRQKGRGQTAGITKILDGAFSRSHVFVTTANTPWRNGHLLKRFYACCRKAGIEDAHPRGAVDIHALRGTYVTLAISHGANPKAVQAMVGHSSLTMTMAVYAKATDHGKRDAVAVLPFATVTAPAGIIPMPNVPKPCANGKKRAQRKA